MSARSYFKLKLPVKPYILKYLTERFGSPMYIRLQDVIGLFIAAVLEKNVYPDLNAVKAHNARLKLTTSIELWLPRQWLLNYRYGTDIPEKKILFINNAIEQMFQRDLHLYYTYNINNYKNKEFLFEAFCNQYNIIIDEDVTMDALIKMEYRYRNKNNEQQRLLSFKNNGGIQAALFS
jgi:hypothetical protein